MALAFPRGFQEKTIHIGDFILEVFENIVAKATCLPVEGEW